VLLRFLYEHAYFVHTKALADWRGLTLPGRASPEPCYLAVLPAMPLRSLLMGITSFAPERHIRMYAGTIPETSTPVKAFSGKIEAIFTRVL